MRRIFFAFFAVLPVLSGCGIQNVAPMPGTEVWQITVNGTPRTLLVHPPSGAGENLPVLLAFHGGYGTASGMEQTYGITPLADGEGFIAVYPQGIDRHWNDGREDPGDISDVQFVEAVMDSLLRRFSIDEGRIYATGMSNGAIFCHFLADRMPGILAGIAPVCGGIADPGYHWFDPEYPLDVVIIQGTEDPLVPYEGGDIGFRGGKGGVLATSEALQIWRTVNDCTENPSVSRMPDLAADGCSAELYLYTGICDLLLVRIESGGHAWPGGEQYLPERVIGRVCEDFRGEDLIWRFFMEAMEREGETSPQRDSQGGRVSAGSRQ